MLDLALGSLDAGLDGWRALHGPLREVELIWDERLTVFDQSGWTSDRRIQSRTSGYGHTLGWREGRGLVLRLTHPLSTGHLLRCLLSKAEFAELCRRWTTLATWKIYSLSEGSHSWQTDAWSIWHSKFASRFWHVSSCSKLVHALLVHACFHCALRWCMCNQLFLRRKFLVIGCSSKVNYNLRCLFEVFFLLLSLSFAFLLAYPWPVIVCLCGLLHMGLYISSHCRLFVCSGSKSAIICIKVTAHCWFSTSYCSHRHLGHRRLIIVELLHLKLLAKRFVDMCRYCRLFHHFKLCDIPLFLPQFHAIACCQHTLVFLFKLIDSCRLNAFWRSQVQLFVHLSVILHKVLEILMHEGHA